MKQALSLENAAGPELRPGPRVGADPLPVWAGIGAVLLGAVLVAARWLTRSRFLVDWDAVNYALALDHYDIRLGQPHPPGYFLYILLGRGVRTLVGEANLALVLVSAAFGLLLVVLLYAVTRELFGRSAGALAAALGMTGPTFWFQSSVASSRTTEAFFATWIAWLCLLVRRRRSRWAFWLLPLVLAAAAGFRQNILLFMLPLCVYATWHVPLRKRLAAGAILIAGVLSWALPMLATSGGLGEYQRQNVMHWQTFITNDSGVFDAPTLLAALRRALTNGLYLFVYTWFLCVLGLPVCLVAARRAWARRRIQINEAAIFLALAAGPALLFFVLFHLRHFGHTVAYAPFFAVVTAAAVRFLCGGRAFLLTGGVLILANLAFTFFYPARLIRGRAITPTLALIREHDAFLASTIREIRLNTRPRDTVIVSPAEISRYWDYYLPEYRRLWVSSAGGQSGSQLRSGRAVVAPNSGPMPSAATRFVFIAGDTGMPPIAAARDGGNIRPLSPSAPWLTIAETTFPARLHLATDRLRILQNRIGP